MCTKQPVLLTQAESPLLCSSCLAWVGTVILHITGKRQAASACEQPIGVRNILSAAVSSSLEKTNILSTDAPLNCHFLPNEFFAVEFQRKDPIFFSGVVNVAACLCHLLTASSSH